MWRVAAVFSVLLVGTTVQGSGFAVAASSTAPDITQLFGQAVTKIRATKSPTFAQAIVLEADGVTRGGYCTKMGCHGGKPAKSASGIVSWRFVFDNQKSTSHFRSATLPYGPLPKRFGTVVGYKPPFVEDVRIPSAPKMTLRKAVILMRRAGFRASFTNVTLRNPLAAKKLNPLYIFGLVNQTYVAVDTVTGKVRRFS